MCLNRAATTLALLLALVAGSRQLSITEFSVPASIEVGEDAELRCIYELKPGESEESLFVKWWVTVSHTNGDRAQLYQRHVGGEVTAIRHNLVIKDNNDTIVLLNLNATDSGVYECEVSSIEEVRQHQQLTVFTQGTGPLVNVSQVPDGADEDTLEDVLVDCSAEDVAPAPDLVLTVNGKEYNMTESVTGPDKKGLYDVSGNYTFSQDKLDGAEIRCELFFLDTTINHQPFVDFVVYNPSGELNTTEAAEDVIEVSATTYSVTENQSGDSTQSRACLALLLAVGAFTLLPTLL